MRFWDTSAIVPLVIDEPASVTTPSTNGSRWRPRAKGFQVVPSLA
jgi:hypothetical protein